MAARARVVVMIVVDSSTSEITSSWATRGRIRLRQTEGIRQRQSLDRPWTRMDGNHTEGRGCAWPSVAVQTGAEWNAWWPFTLYIGDNANRRSMLTCILLCVIILNQAASSHGFCNRPASSPSSSSLHLSIRAAFALAGRHTQHRRS